MIKKIHYCWFGGPMPANVAANIEKWRRLNPDFELCEWNEGNIDVSEYAFGRRALEQKRWGFVADIVRLQKLRAGGGVYLDTDVELLRPLRDLEADADPAITGGGNLILGYIYNCALGTAVIYSPPGHPLIGAILEEYHHIRPDAWMVNNTIFTDYFINHVPGFRLNGRRWVGREERVSLYPKEFFEQPCLRRQNGISIHHASNSWNLQKSGAAFSTGGGYNHRVKWLKRKLRTFVSLLRSEYLPAHLKARLGRPATVKTWWRQE